VKLLVIAPIFLFQISFLSAQNPNNETRLRSLTMLDLGFQAVDVSYEPHLAMPFVRYLLHLRAQQGGWQSPDLSFLMNFNLQTVFICLKYKYLKVDVGFFCK
jgi:hypothetical protein